jgi:hypothetical protein
MVYPPIKKHHIATGDEKGSLMVVMPPASVRPALKKKEYMQVTFS